MNGSLDYRIAIDNSAAVAAAGKVKAVIGGVVAAFAGFKGVQGLMSGVTDAIKKGAGLSGLSAQTGVAVKDLVTLERALLSTNNSAADLPASLFALQKALGGIGEDGEPSAKVFDRLGLSADKLKNMGAVDALTAIQGAMQKLPAGAERTAAALQLFGRNGRGMLEVMNDPNALANAVKSASGAGAAWPRSAAVFAEVSAKFRLFRAAIGDAFMGVASGLMPALQGVMELVQKIDFAKWGRKIGNVAAFVTDAFKNGNLGKIAALTLKIGFGEAANYLFGVLNSIPGVIAAGLRMMSSGDFWGGMLLGLTGLGDVVAATLLKGFQEPILQFQAGMQFAVEKAMELLTGKVGKILALVSPILGLGKFALEKAGISNYKAQSFDDILAQRREDGVRFGFSGMSPNDLMVRGKERFEGAGILLEGPMKKYIEDIAAVAKNFQAANIVDTKSMKEEIAKMLAEFAATQKTVAENQPSGNSGDAAAGAAGGVKSGKGGAANADQFARIGWFIGGGGPSLDYNRRTATASESLLKTTMRIADKLAQPDPTGGALWA